MYKAELTCKHNLW